MIEVVKNELEGMPKIAVVGIGGGGCNAVSRMVTNKYAHVTFIAINTDLQALNQIDADKKLQIGAKLTNGYGAGADPTIGEASANESEEDIQALLESFDMVILTCGLGGGTGTGAIPVIAKLCKSLNILTVSVVTLPFEFENLPRMRAAKNGLALLQENVDTLLVIPNDKLLEISDKCIDLYDAFLFADSVLKYTIEGITSIIYNTGVINLDFNDLKTTLKNKGIGHLGIGMVDPGTPLLEGLKQAIDSPLLDTKIDTACNIILNASGKINLIELNQAMKYLREITGNDVNIIWGTVDNINETDKTVITLIATGITAEEKPSAAVSGNILPKLAPEGKGTSPSISRPGIANTTVRPTVKPKELVIPDFILNRQTTNR